MKTIKTQTTIYISVDLLTKIQRQALRTNTNVSNVISYVMNNYFKETNPDVAMLISCAECGAEYSNKLEQCPNCMVNDIKKLEYEKDVINQENKIIEVENKENELKDAKEYLKKIIAWNRKGKATKKEIEAAEKRLDAAKKNLVKK